MKGSAMAFGQIVADYSLGQLAILIAIVLALAGLVIRLC